MSINIEDLKYPVGKYAPPTTMDSSQRDEWMSVIRSLPSSLQSRLQNLTEAQLETTYRPDGWTLRQVVHHMADSHTNAFFRFKLALTEDNPTIKPYLESLWANLADSNRAPIESSLNIISGIHERWTALMSSMTEEHWQRTFHHPQYQRTSSLHTTLALYAWHSKHHMGHIDIVLNR